MGSSVLVSTVVRVWANEPYGTFAGVSPRMRAWSSACAFERFRRADVARSERGAGLGLAIVEAIAAAHGGRAGAANSAEGGADVWIELKRA